MNDIKIMSEHLTMFSSNAFAQYNRRALSAGKKSLIPEALVPT
jgi:hypothetical protein